VVFPLDGAERVAAEDRAVIGSGEPILSEYRRGTAQGERFLLARKAPLRAVDGSISGVVAIISDVTERVLLEQRLRQSERMESLGLMAGGIAHEFNNLLTIISGNSSLLGTPALTPDQRDDSIAEIRDATRRAASITRQLLTFSRHEVVRPTVLDLCATFRAREQVIRHLLGESIACAFLLPDEPLAVRLDAVQLEQVILNLALNARRSLPNGGTVSIELSRVVLDSRQATVRGVMAGAFVALTVRDDGPGLDDAARARVFEPFFLAHPPTPGGGLGLALVYGAITAAGGAVWVESAPGQGTAYTLLVPLVQDSRAFTASSSTPMPARHPNDAQRATILLVEDERALREMARLILTRAGYQVLEARHGEDALEVVHRTPGTIDLLLTDVVMPAMGGGELSRQFSALRPGVPVLFMSGYSDDEIVRIGVTRADRHFLAKPFAVEELLQAVHSALGQTVERTDPPST
jgi:signal transduction histidine kinase/ActR/RegA family two-component response regulator